MKFFRITTINFSITVIDFIKIILIISPIIMRLKWINMSIALKYSIFIDIFNLKNNYFIYNSKYFTYNLCLASTYLVNGIGWLPITCYFNISIPLYLINGLVFVWISSIFNGSLIKFLPLSILISFADGKWYFGCNGSTWRVVRNYTALGRTPSISSIFNGLDYLWICLNLLGMGSTYVDNEKLVPVYFFCMSVFGIVP